MKEIKIEISLRALIITFLLVIVMWLLLQIKEVIILLVFAFILMSALNPLVEQLEKKMPRVLAISVLYLALVIVIGLLFAAVIPPLVSQTGVFINNLPSILDRFLTTALFLQQGGEQHQIVIATQDVVNFLTQQLSSFSTNIFDATFGFMSGLVSVVFTAVIAFYLLLEHRNLEKQLLNIFPVESQERIFNLLMKVELKLGTWLRSQVLLCFIVGVLSWIGLVVIGVDFALPLAIMAFLLEIIPNIGPLIAGVPAVLVAFVGSPLQGVLTLVWYLIVQETENLVIVPRVMSTSVGLNPLIVIIAILIGGRLGGVVGILLSIPLVAVINVILQDYIDHRQDASLEES